MPRNDAEVSDSDADAGNVTGSGERDSAARAAASDTSAAKVASAEWKKAAQDELVRRVQDAVGGTLFDVRTSKKTEEGS